CARWGSPYWCFDVW
nr:immunoglobulin heavy chain junction region [Mus musculus]